MVADWLGCWGAGRDSLLLLGGEEAQTGSRGVCSWPRAARGGSWRLPLQASRPGSEAALHQSSQTEPQRSFMNGKLL